MPETVRCPACSAEIAVGKRFCGDCGAALPDDATSFPTETSVQSQAPAGPSPQRREQAPTATSTHLSSDPSSGARFLPGTILADRYRVVGLLGRGGMGEVYRADDLKLGQPVALKLLPRRFEQSGERLERFLNEVRLALKVTHPNVCRVFDAGEVDGQHFISMEYIDGEDLSSLLRRIGRLPADKAVEIARQLCAGLAAAHEEGILHRDLKPANVMLDGRGRAKITDFGLAGATSGIEGAEARAGTPGYQAPEQLAGEELTTRTDVYSLGLVLYELFTGERPYHAKSAAELQSMQQTATPTTMTSHVAGLDPLVESVVLRCLEPDPARRPESAAAVAAALPGGDPLAAAVAAGETPSPEMVAAAGGEGGLTTPVAWGLLGAALILLVVCAFATEPTRLLTVVSPAKSRDVLRAEARSILSELAGIRHEDPDGTGGFLSDPRGLAWARDRASGADWYDDELPDLPVLGFWYRESPRPIVDASGQGHVSWAVPRLGVPGEARVTLDHRGRLVSLDVVPGAPPVETDSRAEGSTPWDALLEAAGLARAVRPAPADFVPPHFSDERVAWTGEWPGAEGAAIRVEAAALAGRPVYFKVFAPWEEDAPQDPGTEIIGVFFFFLLGPIIIGGILARRNLRMGRGDRAGATTLAVLYIVVHSLTWVAYLHTSLVALPGNLMVGLGFQLVFALTLWLLYLGMEPMVRRHWPGVWVSWSRLISGRWRDPLVGRHLLLGVAGGLLIAAINRLSWWIPRWLGEPVQTPSAVDFSLLGLPRTYVVGLTDISIHMLQAALGSVAALVLLRVVLRRKALAIAGIAAIVATISLLDSDLPAVDAPVYATTALLWVFLLVRFGFLPGAVALMVVMQATQFTTDLGAWYNTGPAIAMGVVAALAVYGFWVSLAGKPVFGGEPAAASPPRPGAV